LDKATANGRLGRYDSALAWPAYERQSSVVDRWVNMKTAEYWRWRYRNVETGQICRTIFPCSVEEAAKLYAHAERIEGTMILREVDDDDATGRHHAFRRKALG
jgi:hypothetical protein